MQLQFSATDMYAQEHTHKGIIIISSQSKVKPKGKM